MAISTGGTHTLVLYRSSDRADIALRSVCERARESASRVTVVALARQEDPRNGCCDTRSVLWNQVCRDLANEDLSISRPRSNYVRRTQLPRAQPHL